MEVSFQRTALRLSRSDIIRNSLPQKCVVCQSLAYQVRHGKSIVMKISGNARQAKRIAMKPAWFVKHGEFPVQVCPVKGVT